MELIVTIRKQIADRDEGEALYRTAQAHLADVEGLTITGMINNHFVEDPES